MGVVWAVAPAVSSLAAPDGVEPKTPSVEHVYDLVVGSTQHVADRDTTQQGPTASRHTATAELWLVLLGFVSGAVGGGGDLVQDELTSAHEIRKVHVTLLPLFESMAPSPSFIHQEPRASSTVRFHPHLQESCHVAKPSNPDAGRARRTRSPGLTGIC